MKRYIALCLLALLLFTACNSTGVNLDPKNSVTITLWHYYHGVQQTALDELIKEYNSTEGLKRGIAVEAFSYGGVGELSKSVFASAGEEAGALPMPNIFSSYSDSAYELYKLGKLADLGKYFSQKELEKYIDTYLEGGKFSDGVLRVLPVAKSTEIFMLNKTDWDKFEQAVNRDSKYPDVSLEQLKTWEGIVSAAEVYYQWTDDKTEAANDGRALFGLDSSANYVIVGAKQLGLELVDGKLEKAVLNLEVLRRLWDTFYVPMVKGEFAALGRFRSDDVKTGDLLCFTGASTSAAYFPLQVSPESGESYDIEVYVSCYPVFEAAQPAAIQQGAGMCISKSDELHEYAAAEFLKWFTSSERNVDFSIDSAGYFPVTDEGMSMVNSSPALEKIKKSEERSDSILLQVIENSIEQIISYELYSSPVFEKTADLRMLLESLKTDAAAARIALLETVNNKENYQTELNQLTGNEAFDKWVASLNSLFEGD